jgi:hypothetical protein
VGETVLLAMAAVSSDAIESHLPIMETMISSLLVGVVPNGFTSRCLDEPYTFIYPAEWYLDQDSSYVLLASSQELLEASSPAEVGEGGGIQFERMQNALTADPLEALADDLPSFVDNFAGGTADIEEVQGVHLVTLSAQGERAAMATYRATFDGVPLILNRAVVIQGSSSLLFTTIALEETAGVYQPILNTITKSVTINVVCQ